MNCTLKLLILFASSAIAYGLDLKFTQDPKALCLDGSQSSYYYGAGTVKNFFIHFQGGGWIEGITKKQMLLSAYKRSLTELGSSTKLRTKETFPGVFSTDKLTNPEFADWNKIHINYCDGTGHQGYKEAAEQVNGVNLYFRGEAIVKSILSEFHSQLAGAETVVISGCSAGGLAVYYWVQHIRDMLPASVQVVGVPDSGIFINMPAYDGSTNFIKSTTVLQNLVNVETNNPSKDCVLENQGADSWKCFFAQYLVKYIDAPLFIVQSLYDSASVDSLLKISCARDGTLSKCTQSEVNYVEILHSNIQLVINGRFQTSLQNGAYGVSCLEHCFLLRGYYDSPTWSVPYQSGFTPRKALGEWLKTYKQADQTTNKHVDSVNWPSNPGCSRVSTQQN